MPHSVTPRYRDSAGVLHHVWLERSPSGCWRVLDVGPRGAELVEELTGRDRATDAGASRPQSRCGLSRRRDERHRASAPCACGAAQAGVSEPDTASSRARHRHASGAAGDPRRGGWSCRARRRDRPTARSRQP